MRYDWRCLFLQWSGWLTLPALAGAATPFEPYLVLQRRVELYDGTQRAPVRVLPGDVLSACPDESHRGWLTVTLDQKTYQAKAEGLGRLADLDVSYAQRTADLDGRIGELTRQITALADRAAQLYAAEHAIRFDATVQYRYREAIVLPTIAPLQSGPRPALPPPPPIQYTERYEDKVPVSRARHLADRWASERRDVEKEAEALRDQRRDRIRDRFGAETQHAFVSARLAAFRADGLSVAREPYVCVQDRTQLYADTILVEELGADTVVMATPSRDDEQWLRVFRNGQVLAARRAGFLNRLGIEMQMGLRAVWLEQAIRDRLDQADMQAARRQLLESVGLAADYASQLEYVALRVYPFRPDYQGCRYYAFPVCPSAAVEVVNRARARAYIRDCDAELDAIEERMSEIDRTLRGWRRELATLGPRLADLRQRLGAAR